MWENIEKPKESFQKPRGEQKEHKHTAGKTNHGTNRHARPDGHATPTTHVISQSVSQVVVVVAVAVAVGCGWLWLYCGCVVVGRYW